MWCRHMLAKTQSKAPNETYRCLGAFGEVQREFVNGIDSDKMAVSRQRFQPWCH